MNPQVVRWIALGTLVLTAAVLWQLRGHSDADSDPGVAGQPATGLTLYPGKKGIPLPNVSGRNLTGEELDLADYRGHVLVINVWGSWCAPCRKETPDLVAVAAETDARGVRFIGIDVRDNPAAARAFARNYGMTYPSLDDQDGLVLAQFSGIIPVSAVPSTLVIDRSGVVRARVVGVVDATTLRGLIEDVEKLA